ncbi:class I SAM-dependent methyltransferase [Clostridium sp. M62/1]|uniref:class I SAM-dependent methyltransferase n=1 Tax=Clostridium sp. M62/1 TaxID=411486 RepID=UPI00356AEF5B
MFEAVEEKAMVEFLGRFTDYPFIIKFGDHSYPIGSGEPAFTVSFKKAIPMSKLLTSTSLALGEAYMDGDLEVEGNLYNALDHFLGQMGKFSTDEHALKKLIHSSTSKKNQAKEVTSHYDLGNDFYKLWLDKTMSYSCAYFKTPEDSLETAQKNKVDYILEKLWLKEGMSLLDIGCGWGFLLIEAAKKYKIKGTGITLSHEQYREFEKRIQDEGLQDSLTVKLMDYRDLKGSGLSFDRVVSVGMLEHVGRDNYQLFIDCVDSVLKDGGMFLLHFISALKEHPGDPWIKKYIFPGGMIPSLREMISALAEDSFHTLDVENLRLHYNKTLLCWEKNYREHMEEARAMFDERFLRMWELYLSSCAATFHNGIIDIHQILCTKGINNEIPMVRWY